MLRLALFAMIALNTGCSMGILPFLLFGEKKSEPVNDYTYRYPTEDEAERAFNKQRVVCEEGIGKCNPAVGSLITISGQDIYACTAFLVSDDVIATNSHCVIKLMERDSAACQKSMKIHFPDGDYKKCVEVLHKEDLIYEEDNKYITRADFAFVRVGPSLAGKSRKAPLKINREGFKNQQIYEVVAVTGSPDTTRKISSYKSCRAVQNTTFNPYFTKDSSALFALADCPIVPGNSGSPVVSRDGQSAYGIISAMYRLYETKADRTIAHFGLGTNFSCVDTPFLQEGRANGTDCSFTYSKQQTKQKEQDLKSQAPKLKDKTKDLITMFNAWAAKWNREVQWTLLSDKSDSFTAYVVAPRCFQPVETWAEAHKKTGIMSNVYSYSLTARSAFEEMIWYVGVMPNNDGVYDTVLQEVYNGIGSYSFSPNSAIRQGQDSVVLSRGGVIYGKGLDTSYPLKVCEKRL